jgi:hypothetical protein
VVEGSLDRAEGDWDLDFFRFEVAPETRLKTLLRHYLPCVTKGADTFDAVGEETVRRRFGLGRGPGRGR